MTTSIFSSMNILDEFIANGVACIPLNTVTREFRQAVIHNYRMIQVKNIVGLNIVCNLSVIPSIEELGKGSWEIVINNNYLPSLAETLRNSFSGSSINENYIPWAPDEICERSEDQGSEASLARTEFALEEWKKRMEKDRWTIARVLYEHMDQRRVSNHPII